MCVRVSVTPLVFLFLRLTIGLGPQLFIHTSETDALLSALCCPGNNLLSATGKGGPPLWSSRVEHFSSQDCLIPSHAFCRIPTSAVHYLLPLCVCVSVLGSYTPYLPLNIILIITMVSF